MKSEDTLVRGRMSPVLLIAVCVACALSSASAGQVGALTTFTNGTVADANQVNANFAAIETAVNDNDTRIGANDVRITGLEGAVPIRIVLVSPVPGDPVASGTALRAALDAITDNSAANPYLVRLEPGRYDVGTTSLLMKSHVDVAGSGPGITTIRAGAPVAAVSDCELRDLSIDAPDSLGVQVVGGTGIHLRNVAIRSSSVGVMVLWGGAVRFTDVESIAGVGLQIMDDSACVARDCHFEGSAGLGGRWGAFLIETTSLVARNCTFRASGGLGGTFTRSLYVTGSATARCAGCEMGDGAPLGDPGATLKLVDCHDADFDSIADQ